MAESAVVRRRARRTGMGMERVAAGQATMAGEDAACEGCCPHGHGPQGFTPAPMALP